MEHMLKMEHLLERVEREGLEDREMCKKAWVGVGY